MSLSDFTPIQNETKSTEHLSIFWSDMTKALAKLPIWERGFHIFWLLGPFILLIERSPADAWLTILAITFAVRVVIKRDGGWLKVFWVKATFLFWAFVCFRRQFL